MPSRSPHTATIVGGALILAGFVMLVLGWKGGAATLFVPTQVAYGVSGGMTGLALIGTGLAVLVVQTTRLATARRTRDLQHLVTGTVEIFAAVRERTADGTRPLQVPLPRATPAPVPAVSPNGSTSAADLGGWRPEVVMIAGQKTFHVPDCRAIRDPSKALNLTVEEALAAELRACRICAPGT